MNTARLSLIALALTTASIGAAFAADTTTPKTRDQVRAEFVEAQRNGTLIADGQTGATFRDLNPGRYMQPAAMSTATRAQVQAELRNAWMQGELIADGETGLRGKDVFPGSYAAATPVMASPSVQVGQQGRSGASAY